MKKLSKQNVSGFTLIELLVVVLIIGILSAAALPQYTRAVDKAELARIEVLVSDALKAEKLYHLANRTYTTDITNLDLQWPQFNFYNIDYSEGSATAYRDPSKGYQLGLGLDRVFLRVENMGSLTFKETYEGVRSCSNTDKYKHGEYLCNVWKNQK